MKSDESTPNGVQNPFSVRKEEKRSTSNFIQEALQAELIRAKGNLDEADRKNRELVEELYKLKREMSKDNTEKLIEHKDELRTLEKEYENTVRELEKELQNLKTELKFKELEYIRTDRDGWTRLLDFVEENGADFFSNVLQALQPPGGPASQVTPEQLQQAFNQAAAQEHIPPAAGQGGQQEQPITNPDAETESTAREEQPTTHSEPLTDKQMQHIKKSFQAKLLDTALLVLSDQNANVEKYAQQVRSQINMYQQQGITLDGKAWTEMAKVLAERAIEEEITPDRVAAVIRPALDGVKQYSSLLKMVDAEKATDSLFKQFQIQANDQVRTLVTKVFRALQSNLN